MSRALPALALPLAALLAAAAPAAAQPTRIALDGRAGLTVTAVAPAKASSRGAALPTRTVTVAGPRATVAHRRGGLRLRSRERTVELSAIRVRVGARSALTARVAGERRRLFVIAAPATRRTVDATGTSITDAPLRLTRSGAALLRERLRAPAIRTGRFGRIDLDADATTAPAGTPTAPTVTGPPTPGGATLTARPAGAVAIVGGSVRWSPRASWLGYLQQGEGASAEGGATLDGATYILPVSGGCVRSCDGPRGGRHHRHDPFPLRRPRHRLRLRRVDVRPRRAGPQGGRHGRARLVRHARPRRPAAGDPARQGRRAGRPRGPARPARPSPGPTCRSPSRPRASSSSWPICTTAIRAASRSRPRSAERRRATRRAARCARCRRPRARRPRARPRAAARGAARRPAARRPPTGRAR